jgi:hypothetical protein
MLQSVWVSGLVWSGGRGSRFILTRARSIPVVRRAVGGLTHVAGPIPVSSVAVTMKGLFLAGVLWSQQQLADPLALFTMASEHAVAGRRAAALAALEQLSTLPGAFDPGFARPFLSYRGDPRFDRIIARIRSANPPIVRGRLAFTIAERDLQPEGLAFDARSRSVFAGSFKGKIVRVDQAGRVSVFAVTSRSRTPRVVVGLRIDALRPHLWAVVDDPRAFGDPAIGGAEVHVYDMATRALRRRIIGPRYGALNDLVVTRTGDAYVTNTSDGSVWRARVGRDTLQPFLPPGSVPEANGIALSPDDATLFIAGVDHIYRVEINTRTATMLIAPAGVFTGCMDGLYWYRGALVGIQNSIHPGRVMHFALSPTHDHIAKATVLERYHPAFNGVTTAAIDGTTLLYFANTQSRAFQVDGTPRPGVVLTPIQILRLPLP